MPKNGEVRSSREGLGLNRGLRRDVSRIPGVFFFCFLFYYCYIMRTSHPQLLDFTEFLVLSDNFQLHPSPAVYPFFPNLSCFPFFQLHPHPVMELFFSTLQSFFSNFDILSRLLITSTLLFVLLQYLSSLLRTKIYLRTYFMEM